MLADLAYLVPVLWLFGEALALRRVLFFRDLSVFYFPNLVFLERALAQGTWPLWNPLADAGAPFLVAYPPDLLLVGALGSRMAFAWGVPLHLWLAMAGGRRLGRALGHDSWGAWLTGALFGLSGLVLSCVNLLPLFQAAAWAPWVITAWLNLVKEPGLRRAALLSLALALQLGTLAGEIVLMTVLVALLFSGLRGLRPRAVGSLTAATALAALLAAPALAGAWSLIQGTERGRGFAAAQALQFSASPLVLLESLWPRFFGDVHAFSDVGYWGQPFFPEGYPYLLSLYVGPSVLLLALCGRSRPAWALAGLGVLVSLGRNGPLALVARAGPLAFRAPVKLFFLTTVAVAVLAGAGTGTRAQGRFRVLWILPGLVVLAFALGLRGVPDLARHLPLAALQDPRAQLVTRTSWPRDLFVSGALALATGLALVKGGRWRRAAGLVAVLDLLVVNGPLNPLAERSFYELRPEVRAMLARASGGGLFRWFSYGLANTPGLRFIRPLPSDVWLYYMDRQSLLPRANVLDGLESAFDVDRTGWAPAGSTLAVAERDPARYREHHERLRLAGVRWVLSFRPLPPDLVRLHDEVAVPPLAAPLRLYEIPDALPHAFWVPALDAAPTRELSGAEPPAVRYGRPRPHAVSLWAKSPPGFIVVLEGYHPDWRAESGGHPVPLGRAYGRYWALATPGGEQTFEIRFSPGWRAPSLIACAAGLALTTLALARRPTGPFS